MQRVKVLLLQAHYLITVLFIPFTFTSQVGHIKQMDHPVWYTALLDKELKHPQNNYISNHQPTMMIKLSFHQGGKHVTYFRET